MQCQHAHELFSDYVAGQLDRALGVTLDNHLDSCPGCREDVAGLRLLWSDLDKMPVVDPPPFFHENLMHRLNAELTTRDEGAARRRGMWDWRALLRPRAVAFAATILIVLFAGAGFLHTQSAAMWPLSMFAGPSAATHLTLPPLHKPETVWAPDTASGTGGTLVVSLQLEGAVAGASEIDYTVSIENSDPKSDPNSAKSLSGMFLPNGKAVVRVPCATQPDPDKDTLVVTVKSGKDAAQSQVWRTQVMINNP